MILRKWMDQRFQVQAQDLKIYQLQHLKVTREDTENKTLNEKHVFFSVSVYAMPLLHLVGITGNFMIIS